MEVDEIKHRRHEMPRDWDIMVYCSCPNEFTSAHIALLLKSIGFTRIRPLQGGIDAWRKNNYPMKEWSATVTTTGNTARVSQPEMTTSN